MYSFNFVASIRGVVITSSRINVAVFYVISVYYEFNLHIELSWGKFYTQSASISIVSDFIYARSLEPPSGGV